MGGKRRPFLFIPQKSKIKKEKTPKPTLAGFLFKKFALPSQFFLSPNYAKKNPAKEGSDFFVFFCFFLKMFFMSVVLLQLLLDTEVRGVSALLLTAVGGTGGETCVAATAHLLVTVVLTGQGLEGGLHHHSSTEAKHQVKCALLLDVVVSQGAAILQLLAGEDQTLLVRRDALLVLDLSLDVLDGVVRLHLEGDSLTGQGLDEDLHV